MSQPGLNEREDVRVKGGEREKVHVTGREGWMEGGVGGEQRRMSAQEQ